MINLFNINISRIIHNGSPVSLIMLNGDIIYKNYENYGFLLAYTVDNSSNENLQDSYMPQFYSGNKNIGYENIFVTLLDGTVSNSCDWPCNNIAKVQIYYSENVDRISLESNFDLTSVDYINTNNLTNMNKMFYNCFDLTTLDVSNWNTSQVIDMNNMFYQCHNLITLDLSSFDTSNVANTSCMFYGCNKLTTLDLSNFGTSNATTMLSMFSDCEKLTSLDLSSFDTKNVTTMASMFSRCNNLTSLDLSSFDTSNVTTMFGMFSDCEKLTSLDLSKFDTSNVTNMTQMFLRCNQLKKLDLRNFDTKNVTTMSNMFYLCGLLNELRLDNCSYDTVNAIINSEGFPTNELSGGRFIYCNREFIADLTNPTNWIFIGVDSVEPEPEEPVDPDVPVDPDEPDVPVDPDVPVEPNPDESLYIDGQFKNSTATTINVLVDETHTNLKQMFYGCESLTTINGIENWDTKNVTDMESMFYNCKSLIELDLSCLDTNNVTDMYRTFCGCESLTTLNISNFDVSKLTAILSIYQIFTRCYALTNLQAPQNINKNIDFSDCSLLTHDSLMDIINNLSTVTSTKTLTLGTTNLAKLTDAEKAIAINKGWTLA